MNKAFNLAGAVLLMACVASVSADQRTELLKLQHTTLNLIEALVTEGILSRERADQLIAEAEQEAEQQVKQEERSVADKRDVVRVPYVPEFVKDEIRDEVRAGLREDVVNDVMSQAKNERWGVPGALPEWTSKIKLSGDVRVRWQSDLYANNNKDGLYFNFQGANRNGGLINNQSAILNTTEDRHRARARVRLNLDAKVSNNIKMGLRLVSGDPNDPVSANQTLGTDRGKYSASFDRTYLRYKGFDSDTYNWITLYGGRMPNPWLHTNMVWDSDLNFDGIASTFRYNLTGSDNLYDMDEQDKNLFFTLGAFPLEEFELSSRDKWLYGAQLGMDWTFQNQSRLRFGVAYYDYENITGEKNALDSRLKDFTAPTFVQKGNTMFEISNDDPASFRKFALGSDYNILNMTAKYDIANFSPTHIILTADYALNLGYDKNEVIKRTGGVVFNPIEGSQDPFRKRNRAYKLGVLVGWPKLRERRQWNVSAAYKYLERDAVLDAFTDSDFHLGGTDAKGWVVSAGYGLDENTWMRLRWLTSDAIDGPPLGVDTLQLDLNSRF